jgi:hypothetical protein
MAIKLTRALKMERCEAIGRAQLEHSRPDLKTILEKMCSGTLKEPPKRLLDYFEKLGIYSNGNILDAGEQLLLNEKILTDEYCHYEFWYIRGDPWLETTPVALRRIEAQRKNKDNRNDNAGSGQWQHQIDNCWHVFSENEKPVLVQVDDETYRLKSLDIDALLSQQNHAEGNLECILNNLEGAEIILSSSVKWKHDNNLNKISVHMPWPTEKVIILLPEIARHLKKEWDSDKAALIEDNVPSNIDELTTFKKDKISISNLRTEYAGNFDTAEITNVPIRAGSARCAENWLKELMRYKWSQKYTSVQACQDDQREWLNSIALEEYGLQPLESEMLLQAVDKNMAGKAYWHIAALQDLVPPGVKTKNLQFTLNLEDNEPIKTISSMLKENQNFTEIRIIDRYVGEKKHIRMIDDISRELGIKSVTLVSLKVPEELPDNWNHILMNRRTGENHDRYWCLMNGGNPSIWKVSTSLEFLKFNNGSIKVEGPATFVPLEYADVTSEIKNYIKASVGDII